MKRPRAGARAPYSPGRSGGAAGKQPGRFGAASQRRHQKPDQSQRGRRRIASAAPPFCLEERLLIAVAYTADPAVFHCRYALPQKWAFSSWRNFSAAAGFALLFRPVFLLRPAVKPAGRFFGLQIAVWPFCTGALRRLGESPSRDNPHNPRHRAPRSAAEKARHS